MRLFEKSASAVCSARPAERVRRPSRCPDMNEHNYKVLLWSFADLSAQMPDRMACLNLVIIVLECSTVEIVRLSPFATNPKNRPWSTRDT